MGAAASDYFTSYADVQYGFLDAELGVFNFHELAAKGDFHHVSIYLKKGLDPNGRTFDDDDAYERQDTPLICCVRGLKTTKGTKRHVKTLEVLVRFGARVNDVNVLEQTPLYVACEHNLLNIATWLLAHGADVHKCDKAGVSPLLLACQHENPALVQLLLTHGAIPVARPKQFSCLQFPVVATKVLKEQEETKSRQKELVQAHVAKYMQKHEAKRQQETQQKNDQLLIEQQTIYRERLEQEGEVRRRNRREQRQLENYRNHLAKIERKRHDQRTLRPREEEEEEEAEKHIMTSLQKDGSSKERVQTQQSKRLSTVEIASLPPAIELVWTKSTEQSGQRPKWSAREMQQTNRMEHQKDTKAQLMASCQDIYKSIQVANSRRLRVVHTAPDAEMYRQHPVDINNRFLRPWTAQ